MKYKKKIYAFIFARKNSTRLKNKNLRKIGGKSLVERSIRIAKSINDIEKIFVSSDSPDIIKIAKKEKVNYIIRPNKLAQKNSLEIDAWKHAINHLKKKRLTFDHFLSLPPTSPLKSIKDIKNLINYFQSNRSDITLTVCKSHRSPFYNMVYRNKNCKVQLINKKKENLNKIFEITTVGYIAKVDYILKTKNLFSGLVKSIIIPRERAIDIDDEYDLKLAKFFYENRK